MNFYKLDKRSQSYISVGKDMINQNIYTEEDMIIWAKDVANMNNMSVKVSDGEVAIEVLDRHGEYLEKVV